MRPIKFRAWDAKNKKYADLQTAEVYLSGHGHLFVGETTEYGTHDDFNEYVLEQFTGLTDKNGKEIYEGDICKDTDGRILEVGWSDKFASFVLMSKKWAFKHWFGESCQSDEVEIIGNIHDNPELIQ